MFYPVTLNNIHLDISLEESKARGQLPVVDQAPLGIYHQCSCSEGVAVMDGMSSKVVTHPANHLHVADRSDCIAGNNQVKHLVKFCFFFIFVFTKLMIE